jgi:DNA-directed RNA polymerase subunit RPC12/RpoP
MARFIPLFSCPQCGSELLPYTDPLTADDWLGCPDCRYIRPVPPDLPTPTIFPQEVPHGF